MSTAVIGQGTDDRHYDYPPTGRRLTPVTTVLDATDAKQHILVPWSARLAAWYAVDNLAALMALLGSEGGREAAIKLITSQAERRRNLKRDTGTHIHDVVEALVLWGASPDGTGNEIVLPTLPENLAGAEYDDEPIEDVIETMQDGFINFVADFRPEFVAAEMTVYNAPLGIAGTLDLILILRGVKVGKQGRLVPAPGSIVVLCIDVKTGRVSVTWKEQVAAYRRMREALMPMGDLVPMPATDHAAVLHLHASHPRGYRLMVISGREDAAAWNRFRRALDLHNGRKATAAKPGKVCYPLRPDGTIQPPRLTDLDGEGYGRVLSPLIKAGAEDLEQLAAMTAAQVLAVKGIGEKTLAVVRQMLADHDLALAGEDEKRGEAA